MDLTVSRMHAGEEVIVRRRAEGYKRAYPCGNNPAYRFAELARNRHQPYLKGLDITVLGGGDGEIRHGLHEYLYNYGNATVRIGWDGEKKGLLNPSDSAYVRPFVKHRFEPAGSGEEGKLLAVRVPGQLNDAVLDELATFLPSERGRLAAETKALVLSQAFH